MENQSLYTRMPYRCELTELRQSHASNMAIGNSMPKPIWHNTKASCTVAMYQGVGCCTDCYLGCIRHSLSIVNNSHKLKWEALQWLTIQEDLVRLMVLCRNDDVEVVGKIIQWRVNNWQCQWIGVMTDSWNKGQEGITPYIICCLSYCKLKQ